MLLFHDVIMNEVLQVGICKMNLFKFECLVVIAFGCKGQHGFLEPSQVQKLGRIVCDGVHGT